MHERLTIDEINARYDSEWVLVEDPISNEAFELQSGVVRCHSPRRDDVYGKAAELKLKRSAVLYTGAPREDLEFAL